MLTFHLSFAAKMLMVSRSVYGASITASQYVHGILIFPTLLFQASALVYICFNSAALEMHGGFFQRHHIEQPGDSSGWELQRIGILSLWLYEDLEFLRSSIKKRTHLVIRSDISLGAIYLRSAMEAFMFSFSFTSDWTKCRAELFPLKKIKNKTTKQSRIEGRSPPLSCQQLKSSLSD